MRSICLAILAIYCWYVSSTMNGLTAKELTCAGLLIIASGICAVTSLLLMILGL